MSPLTALMMEQQAKMSSMLHECCQTTWHIPRLHRPLLPQSFACRSLQDQWNKLCTPSVYHEKKASKECAVLTATYIMQLTGFFHIPARHFRAGLFPRPFLARPEGSGVQTNAPRRDVCHAPKQCKHHKRHKREQRHF